MSLKSAGIISGMFFLMNYLNLWDKTGITIWRCFCERAVVINCFTRMFLKIDLPLRMERSLIHNFPVGYWYLPVRCSCSVHCTPGGIWRLCALSAPMHFIWLALAERKTYRWEQPAHCLFWICWKKSFPLSSTRTNAGKFSTSIFQIASIPSSG